MRGYTYTSYILATSANHSFVKNAVLHITCVEFSTRNNFRLFLPTTKRQQSRIRSWQCPMFYPYSKTYFSNYGLFFRRTLSYNRKWSVLSIVAKHWGIVLLLCQHSLILLFTVNILVQLKLALVYLYDTFTLFLLQRR